MHMSQVSNSPLQTASMVSSVATESMDLEHDSAHPEDDTHCLGDQFVLCAPLTRPLCEK